MIWEKLRQCCSLAEESLNGNFGWFWDIATIFLIIIFFNFIFKRFLVYLEGYFKAHNKLWEQSFVSALYAPLSCFIWFFSTVEILDFVAKNVLSMSYLPSSKDIFLKIGQALSFGWFMMRWKRNIAVLMRKRNIQNKGADASRIDVIDKIATVLILIMTVMLLLEVTGNNLNTLIAFGGISGLALAFASQEVIASFFGGLMIYLNHPFVIGDWVVLPEKSIEGHVEEIGWYTTKIRTFDKRPIYVPNSIFSKIVVVNPSRMTHCQIKETIGIRYRDVKELKGIITEIKKMLEAHPNIDKGMSYSVYFSAFGSYSLNITVSAYTRETSIFSQIKEEFLFNIIDILEKHHAELAIPTTCVKITESPSLMNDSSLTKSKGV